MKNAVILMIAVLMVMASAISLGEEGKLKISGGWETAVSSIYLGVEGTVIHDKPILENSLVLQFGESGWTAGIWTAFPLQEQAAPQATESPTSLELSQTRLDASGNEQTTTLRLNFAEAAEEAVAPFDGEIDIFAGWGKQFSCLRLDAKLTWWLIGDLGEPADDNWLANLKLSLPDCPLVQPFVEFEHIGEVGDLSSKGGNFVFAGLTRSQKLGFKLGKSEEEQALDLELRCAWSDGTFGCEPAYVYTRLTALTDIRISRSCHIVPSLLYQMAGPDQNGALADFVDGDKLVARLAFGFDF